MPREGLESLVSPYVGVVRGVQEVLAGPQDIRLATMWCESAHAGALLGVETAHTGGGSGSSAAEARAAAIGEAVERYSACYLDEERLVVATARELGPRAVDPHRFALFSDEQYRRRGFPYVRFTRDTRLAWIEGRSLPDGRPALLPAQLVHLVSPPGEPRIGRPTSSGLACHTSAERATLSALLEVLERDAFMITWKTQLSWPRLDWSGDPALERFVRTRVRPTGLRVRAIDLSAFWDVPCVLGVARSRVQGDAPLGVGAAAAPTIERAVQKALDEAVRVRSWAHALRSARVPLPADIRDFDDHVRFYAEPAHAGRTSFLDASHERRRVRDIAPLAPTDRVGQLCERLERRSASAYAVELTAPDVRDAGLAVTRVMAPELCALDVEHAAPLLGGRRLYDEPVRLGFGPRPINLDPHPFP